MRRWHQALLALGLLAFAATGWAVVEDSCQHPRLVAASHGLGRELAALVPDGCRQVPAMTMGTELVAGLARGDLLGAAWEARRWYPYALAPLWLATLVLAWALPAWRRRLGALLLVLAVVLAAFEGCYLGLEYQPLLPWLGRLEVLLAWLTVVAVLFLRRRDDRGLGAVEAHVGAQALLGALHLLTLPTSQARGWIGAHNLGDVFAAVTSNFRPPFWLGLAALLVAAGAVYLRRGVGAALPVPTTEAPAAAVTASTSP